LARHIVHWYGPAAGLLGVSLELLTNADRDVWVKWVLQGKHGDWKGEASRHIERFRLVYNGGWWVQRVSSEGESRYQQEDWGVVGVRDCWLAATTAKSTSLESKIRNILVASW
jgi:hypothetical protein